MGYFCDQEFLSPHQPSYHGRRAAPGAGILPKLSLKVTKQSAVDQYPIILIGN
jgi:hypothetical protein